MKNKSFAELQAETIEISSYIRSLGYTLVEMRECEWIAMKEADPTIEVFTKRQFESYLYHRGSMTGSQESQILSTINGETMFELALVDIYTLRSLEIEIRSDATDFQEPVDREGRCR